MYWLLPKVYLAYIHINKRYEKKMFNIKKIKKAFMYRFRALFPRISRSLFFDCMVKKKGLEYRINDIDLLVLGSSHAKCAFDSSIVPNSFNLGTDNQDLYTAYHLLKSYIPKMKALKNVVLFYSLFSPGFELAKTKSYRDICLHHYVFWCALHCRLYSPV